MACMHVVDGGLRRNRYSPIRAKLITRSVTMNSTLANIEQKKKKTAATSE